MRQAIGSRVVLATTATITIALAAASVSGQPRWLYYNRTESAPHGWYLHRNALALHTGDLVFARLPDDAARVASDRRYLPLNVPLIKQIAAVEGTEVCVLNGKVLVAGLSAGVVLERDGAGRPLSAWMGCRMLGKHELFLLGASRTASFDSRYFGPVTREAVLGKAIPLWTW